LQVGAALHTKLGRAIKVASPIQAAAIPILLHEERPDVLIQAPTGTHQAIIL
jgi:superfamily II DNA/RNA helicase